MGVETSLFIEVHEKSLRTVKAYNDFQKSVYPMLTDSSRFFILRSKKKGRKKIWFTHLWQMAVKRLRH